MGNCVFLGPCMQLGPCIQLGDEIIGSSDPAQCDYVREILAFLAKHDLTLAELLEAVRICEGTSSQKENIVKKNKKLNLNFGQLIEISNICASIKSELSKATIVYLIGMAEDQQNAGTTKIKSARSAKSAKKSVKKTTGKSKKAGKGKK